MPVDDRQVPCDRRVVFFGTPFLLVRNLPPELYAQRLNACLDYLRRNYAGRCKMVYRPRRLPRRLR